MGNYEPAFLLQLILEQLQIIAGTGGGGTPSDPSEVNITQYGGTATTLGRKAAAASAPVVVSDEDRSVLSDISVYTSDTAAAVDSIEQVSGGTTDAAVSTDAAGTINAHIRGIIVNLISLLARLPTTLGQKTSANSLAVVVASDQSPLTVDTELPAAAALSDSTANPTTPMIGSALMVWSTATWQRAQSPSGDSMTGSSIMAAGNMMFGVGAGVWERWRNNGPVTILASAARTATTTTAFTNYNWRGMVLFVNVTAQAVATTLTPSVRILDPVSSGSFTTWTAAAAINTGSGLFAYLFYPGVTASAPVLYTEEVDMPIPRTGNIVITHSDANSITYSVAVQYIL